MVLFFSQGMNSHGVVSLTSAWPSVKEYPLPLILLGKQRIEESSVLVLVSSAAALGSCVGAWVGASTNDGRSASKSSSSSAKKFSALAEADTATAGTTAESLASLQKIF